MRTTTSEITRLSRPEELKALLSTAGPCISVYFSGNRENLNPGDAERRWRQVIRQIDSQKKRLGEHSHELIGSLSDWGTVAEDRNAKEKTLVIFRSPDFFYRIWMRANIEDRISIGPQVYIRPLLPFVRDPVFYLLALSQNDVRLLRCTLDSSEQKPLPGASTNFDEYMNSAEPDHVRENRATAGPGAGSSKGVIFGAGSDVQDDPGEYLAHYFRQIDRALNTALRDKGEPVILAGVEYERSLYQAHSTYPHLLPEGIQGAPNGLKGGEMHSRALEVLVQHHMKCVDKVIAEYNHLAGGGRATNRLKEIVAAAHDGRVVKLIVSDSVQQAGSMDELTHEVVGAKQEEGEEYDLLNDAAVQTILHAGQVFIAPNRKMPNGSPLAAIFRY